MNFRIQGHSMKLVDIHLGQSYSILVTAISLLLIATLLFLLASHLQYSQRQTFFITATRLKEFLDHSQWDNCSDRPVPSKLDVYVASRTLWPEQEIIDEDECEFVTEVPEGDKFIKSLVPMEQVDGIVNLVEILWELMRAELGFFSSVRG